MPDSATATISWRLSADAVEASPPPFAPYRFVSSVTHLPDGPRSCWFEFNGTRVAERSGEGCAGFSPSASSPGEAEYRMVTTFVPAGAAAPAEAVFGSRVGEAEAEVEVRPDGTLGGCRVVLQNGVLARGDFCLHVRSTWSPLQASPDAAARRGRVRLTLHERLGSPL